MGVGCEDCRGPVRHSDGVIYDGLNYILSISVRPHPSLWVGEGEGGGRQKMTDKKLFNVLE